MALLFTFPLRKLDVRLFAVVAGPLLLLSAVACTHSRTSSPSIKIDIEITPQPVRVGAATVRLDLRDLSGQPVTGAHIRIEGNMTHPGMKPEFGEAKEVEPGRYEAPLEFTMAGDWLILYQVTLQSGEKLERQIDVKGVRAN